MTFAPRAKQNAIPITIVNSVIHMARSLFCERIALGSPANETPGGGFGSLTIVSAS
jgi:hypothetical protein